MYRDSGTYVVQGTGVSSPRDDTLVRKDNTCSDSSASSMFISKICWYSYQFQWGGFISVACLFFSTLEIRGLRPYPMVQGCAGAKSGSREWAWPRCWGYGRRALAICVHLELGFVSGWIHDTLTWDRRCRSQSTISCSVGIRYVSTVLPSFPERWTFEWLFWFLVLNTHIAL